ncbi:GAF domain-containing protein [Neosynechococcus sphagnicola]|uniref:GAF domain-containing protein n=1 Tax=Neosynechococcus sphagnicola TaxID=1501145 RepID=UPI00068C0A5C|nr:GAF domain-containing protein [Neosynechococcus sphagnicola]
MNQAKEPAIYEKQLMALGQVLQTLRESKTIQSLVEGLLGYLQVEFEFNLIWIGLYKQAEHQLVGIAGITPTVDANFVRQKFTLNPGDVLEQVVMQQSSLRIPDLREEARAGEWRKAAQRFNIQGTAIYPIRQRGRCWGVVMLGTHRWGFSPRNEEKLRILVALGEMGALLEQLELAQQQQQVKQPEESLLMLLTKLRSLPNLNQRLDAILAETHRFIAPSRTYIYWFDQQRRLFWRRGMQPAKAGRREGPAEIAVQDLAGFYQALVGDQMVVIGEAQTVLKADTTHRLLQYTQAQALVAAPILYQNELKGFLWVESHPSRIWLESEKKLIRATSHLVGLTAPLEEMELTLKQTRADQSLVTVVARAIACDQDWQATLKNCAEELCHRLQVDRVLLLLWDADQGKFTVRYQSHPPEPSSAARTPPSSGGTRLANARAHHDGYLH